MRIVERSADRLMKGSFALVSLGVVVLSLASCGKKPQPSDFPAAQSLVRVTLGGEQFMVPSSYLSWGDLLPVPISSEENGRASATVFLPDYSGFPKDYSPVGPGSNSINMIRAYWQTKGVGDATDGERMLNNLLSANVIQRNPEADLFGLEAYSEVQNDSAASSTTYYVAEPQRDSVAMIRCTRTPFDQTCKMNYFHQLEERAVEYWFDAMHLREWRSIDEQIHSMIVSWSI